ncbi:hypothetical protein EJ02DRAFT_173469 [Clathrospora elynae]|uniref:Uncharacterized protein n=1 Tax=Clathrospora elynae TaxID=706981 RepID=A0A6A5T3B5_9PLEO|nr:hypothetical protein EJ02DRAFT_173469 [Clathrospora elynae]
MDLAETTIEALPSTVRRQGFCSGFYSSSSRQRMHVEVSDLISHTIDSISSSSSSDIPSQSYTTSKHLTIAPTNAMQCEVLQAIFRRADAPNHALRKRCSKRVQEVEGPNASKTTEELPISVSNNHRYSFNHPDPQSSMHHRTKHSGVCPAKNANIS